MKDRFDFEQDIYNCWHIIDDLQQLYKMILNKNTSTEDIANILLGLQTLYNDRFLQLMDDFEMEENLMTTDLKLKGIEIDFETADNIIRASMLNQYHDIKEEIENQKNVESPQEYQKVDLKYNEKVLDACITVLKHYTAYDEWPEELKDKWK
jgi:transcriptional regulator of heat shock response